MTSSGMMSLNSLTIDRVYQYKPKKWLVGAVTVFFGYMIFRLVKIEMLIQSKNLANAPANNSGLYLWMLIAFTSILFLVFFYVSFDAFTVVRKLSLRSNQITLPKKAWSKEYTSIFYSSITKLEPREVGKLRILILHYPGGKNEIVESWLDKCEFDEIYELLKSATKHLN